MYILLMIFAEIEIRFLGFHQRTILIPSTFQTVLLLKQQKMG